MGPALKTGAVLLDRAGLVAGPGPLNEVAGPTAVLGGLDRDRAQARGRLEVGAGRAVVADDPDFDRTDPVNQPEAPVAGRVFQGGARLPAEPTGQPADVEQRLDDLV